MEEEKQKKEQQPKPEKRVKLKPVKDDKKDKKKKRKDKKLPPFYFVGLKESLNVFYEDLSILLTSGMDIISAVKAIRHQMKAKRMKKILTMLIDDLDAGVSFTSSLERLDIAPSFVLSLIKIGEASGNLAENIQVAVAQQKRLKEFFSTVQTAMIYPAIILSLTVAVGLSSTWFVLPKLTSTFTSLRVELPAMTKGLIATGDFISIYGIQIIPTAIVLLVLIGYFLFGYKKTRFVGLRFLFVLPISRKILRDSEVARMGFLLGVLLEAGMPITEALKIISNTTELKVYKKLYSHMADSVLNGDSIERVFDRYKHTNSLIPATAQYMITAGERGGSLAKSLQGVGDAYEKKTTVHLRTITTILEPLVLIIVGLGVVGVALSILLPIYSIIGGIR